MTGTAPWRRAWLGAALAVVLLRGPPGSAADADADRQVAERLATLLQAARTVISEKQELIDRPAGADKGLTGAAVLDLALPIFAATAGFDLRTSDPDTREGRLLRAEMAAIVAVVDANQTTFHLPGVGFKGFIPAVFARLVSEDFARRVDGAASIRVTAPPPLVRNRKSRPDAWETDAIGRRFLAPGWTPHQPFAEHVQTPDGPVFRLAVPEYYDQSCLSCHGGPAGALDVTGHPREGAGLGDLGGVISVILRR